MRTVYLGRDNTFDLFLERDGVPENASNYNRFVLYLKDPKSGTIVTIDSSTAPAGTFVSTNTRFLNSTVVNVLTCLLGLGTFGLVANTVYECWLRVYNAQITNGLVWPDHDGTIRIKVLSGQ